MFNKEILLNYSLNHHIFIHIIDKNKKCLFKTIKKDSLSNTIYNDKAYQKITAATNTPRFQTMNKKELYASFSHQGLIYIIGPVLYNYVLTFQDQYNLSFYPYLNHEGISLSEQIPIMSLDIFYNHVAFIYTLITNQKPKPLVKSEKPLPAYIDLEYEPFDLEKTLKMIEEVIVNKASEKLIFQQWKGYDSLMSYDTNKQAMYIFVSLLTYCTTIAIKEGLSLQKALKLKDQYILKADLCLSKADLFDLFKAYIKTLCEIIPSKNKYSYEINQCINYINDHLNEDLSTDILASNVHLSRTYLCSRFKKETKQTISCFIMQQRLACAKELLKKTNYSQATICQLSGFKSLSYFSSSFKKVYQITPSEYKKSNSQKYGN